MGIRPVTETVARKCDLCDDGWIYTNSRGKRETLENASLSYKCPVCKGFGLVARKCDERNLVELVATLEAVS